MKRLILSLFICCLSFGQIGCSDSPLPPAPKPFTSPELASSWDADGVFDIAAGANGLLYFSRPAGAAIDVILTRSPSAPHGGWIIQSMPGESLQPTFLDVGPHGTVAVVVEDRRDTFPYIRGRFVHRYSPLGDLLASWRLDTTTDIHDVAVDGLGNIYLLEDYPGRVVKYSSDGTILRAWTGEETPDGQFQLIVQIRLPQSDEVLVLDRNARTLYEFTSAGVLEESLSLTHPENGFSMEGFIADSEERIHVARSRTTTITTFNAVGEHLLDWGEFRHPSAVEVGDDGEYFVKDDGRVSLWTID